MIQFCSPVAELSRWLGTPKLSGIDHLAQTRQVQISSPHRHPHAPATPPNPTCSGRFDHEWLKVDYKPDTLLTHTYWIVSYNIPFHFQEHAGYWAAVLQLDRPVQKALGLKPEASACSRSSQGESEAEPSESGDAERKY